MPNEFKIAPEVNEEGNRVFPTLEEEEVKKLVTEEADAAFNKDLKNRLSGE